MSEIYCCKECARLFDEDTLYFLGTIEEVKNSFPDVEFPPALCYDHENSIEGIAYRKFAHIRRRELLTHWPDFSKIDSLFKNKKEIFLSYLVKGDVSSINKYAACQLEILCDMLVEKTQGKTDISIMFLRKNGSETTEDSKSLLFHVNDILKRDGIAYFCEILGPRASVALLVPRNRDEAIHLFKQLESNLEITGTLYSYPPNYKIADLQEKYEQAKPRLAIDEFLRATRTAGEK